jgi:N-hydroxyarylamine O-acetyltransferase
MTSFPMDLEAYFRRIGYDGPREPTLRCLEALHLAHATRIPFENLDIQLGRPIRLDLESLQAKLVRAGRGGYCFEQNTLFAAVLARLGFTVDTLEARVRLGVTEPPRPRTHMALRVRLGSGDWLADVGFGGEGLLLPVPFGGGECTRLGDTYRLRPEGRVTLLQCRKPEGWLDFYALEPEPALAIDFELGNHYTSTFPESGFVRTLTVQLPAPDLRRILRNRTLTTLRGGQAEVRDIRDPDELLVVLREEFGLDFPAGTRFRNPEFP